MKAWFDYCDLNRYTDGDSNIKLGIGWYKHHANHPWRGFTIQLYLYFWLVDFTAVNNYKAYKKRMEYKRDPDHLKKLGERLKAIREKKKE